MYVMDAMCVVYGMHVMSAMCVIYGYSYDVYVCMLLMLCTWYVLRMY